MVQQVQSCLPQAQAGTFDEDGKVCRFEDGATLEFDGTVERPAQGRTGLPVTEHRLVGGDGNPCLTTRFQAIADVAYDVGGSVWQLRSENLNIEVTCPDGTSYANDVEGTCADDGVRWLAGELPGYDFSCDSQECRADAKGSTDGKQTLARCGW